MKFNFDGCISPSKSILLRLLLAESYVIDRSVSPFFTCDDVSKMAEGLVSLFKGEPVNCGDSATALRFLAIRASRLPGTHRIFGSDRLLSRPHGELANIFEQLGVKSQISESQLIIESNGWPQKSLEINVDRSISSQFASSLLLNSWLFVQNIKINWNGSTVSRGYWELSVKLAQKMGMKMRTAESSVEVLPNQSPFVDWSLTEPDMSSAFTVAVLASVSGQARIKTFPTESLQPDACFIDVLKKMGGDIEHNGLDLIVRKASAFQPISFDLSNFPDLFPVLSVLCALAEGKSHLFGAAHLAYKESHRIRKTAELIRLMGRKCEETLDGIIIYGQKQNSHFESLSAIIFDPDNDHRLVMAAGVARAAGLNIVVTNPNAVRKSFPEFLEISPL